MPFPALKINFELFGINKNYSIKEVFDQMSRKGKTDSISCLKIDFELLGKNEKQAGTDLCQAQLKLISSLFSSS